MEERTQFNWAACPVARERIEQINLCRNDLTHQPAVGATWPRQSQNYFRKYPVSLFADELDQALADDGEPEFPAVLNITRDKLIRAIEDARQFCTFVEAQGTQW